MNAKNIWLYAIGLSLMMTACSSEPVSPTEAVFQDSTIVPTEFPTETEMPSPEPSSTPNPEPFAMSIPGFPYGETIPARFACTGENYSPEINWNEAPAGTESFALLFDDPDAPGGSWVHWILFNIPADARTLVENIPGASSYPDGSKSGANSWAEGRYGGPCPPQGSTHEYVFLLYALDTMLDLNAGASKAELLVAVEDHTLTIAQYTGVFGR